jgi:hypothetical protein
MIIIIYNKIMNQNNIVIISHCRDEIVYFYEYIDHTSLLVLVTKPASKRDYEIFNKFVVEVGCRCIELDEPDTFNPSFELSNKAKDIISNLIKYNPRMILTQAKATVESDVVSRRIYDYVSSLKTDVHYVPQFNLNKVEKKMYLIPNKYIKVYSKNDEKKEKIMQNTYMIINGIKQVS